MLQRDASALMDDMPFRVALAKRIGGGLRPTQATPIPCRHSGGNGGCTGVIAADGRHASICAVGGFAIQRHDRVARWLQRWLAEGRTSVPPLLEQVCPVERGRLDVTFVHEGTPVWVDVAITNASSSCERTQRERALHDGRAARDEEAVKRSRYHGRATPFVLEAHGRPGPSALAFIRTFSAECSLGASQSAAEAWAALSSIS